MFAKERLALPISILPRQASYAGSTRAQSAIHEALPAEVEIPAAIHNALLGNSDGDVSKGQMLYKHQVRGITAALQRREHVIVATGTGSGKSLCFWVPLWTSVYCTPDRTAALVLFPTKALAQDQLSNLQKRLALNDELTAQIRPATLDGDTPHPNRSRIAQDANIILTNPNTLHAAILPNWKQKHYQALLSRIEYIVLDEAHLYEGTLGAHVALILSRLALRGNSV